MFHVEQLRTLRAFLLGMWEFRRMVTSHFDGALMERYDRGREMAHRLTLRRFER